MKCRKTFKGSGTRCASCGPVVKRPSGRGYDHQWRKVRAEVLTAYGIQESQWNRYAVDHNPPYNPEIEPDHAMYQLIPRLIRDHNRKTAESDTRRDHKGRFSGKS